MSESCWKYLVLTLLHWIRVRHRFRSATKWKSQEIKSIWIFKTKFCAGTARHPGDCERYIKTQLSPSPFPRVSGPGGRRGGDRRHDGGEVRDGRPHAVQPRGGWSCWDGVAWRYRKVRASSSQNSLLSGRVVWKTDSVRSGSLVVWVDPDL